MPKYYVPVVLVVEATDILEASVTPHKIVDKLVKLEVGGVHGGVYPCSFVPSFASPNWSNFSHALSTDDSIVEVVEV